MSKRGAAPLITFRQQQVLDQLQGRARTWDELRKLMQINEEGLGLAVMELLNLRKIWVTQKNDVRFYGLERRVGLVPRFSYPRRRSTDG